MLTFPGLVVVDEKHWGKFGRVENGEEWATAHFQVFVATENPIAHNRARARARHFAARLIGGLGLARQDRARGQGILSRQDLDSLGAPMSQQS